MNTKSFDVAVVGAGVFGAWTAWHLRKRGLRVRLLDAYGPGNSRASSGGESRIIRAGYGADAIYSRWSRHSLGFWKRLDAEHGRAALPVLHQTGVLWIGRRRDVYVRETRKTLDALRIRSEQLSPRELARRFPQMSADAIGSALFEPDAGVLMARRAVQAVVRDAVRAGVEFACDAAAAPETQRGCATVRTRRGEILRAGVYVFACGPWLPRLFPRVLGRRIRVTRQEVGFFGVPAGDLRFAPPAMPAWVDFAAGIYGTPDLEGRGFKIGLDRHGPPFDPECGDRVVGPSALKLLRDLLVQRFPPLKDSPLVEARVCQYENTSSGDFLVDRHPDFDNVWLVGGGSGHGFKHGPAVGEYVAARLIDGGPLEPRFTLETKSTTRARAVF